MEKIIENAAVVTNFVPVYTLYIRRNGRKITRYKRTNYDHDKHDHENGNTWLSLRRRRPT